MRIRISVADKVATNPDNAKIVCGNSDYVIAFEFDDTWDSQAVKTARFVYQRHGKTLYDEVVFTGTDCPVPVLYDVLEVRIGVYAGNLSTSTPARVECERSIKCGDPVHDEPPEDVYTQIVALVDEVALSAESASRSAEDAAEAAESASEAAERAADAADGTITGKGAPTTSTVASVGNLYMDIDTGNMYKCIATDGDVYMWAPLDGGANADSVTIDDTQIANNSTWSSKKIATELDVTNAFIFEEKKGVSLPNSCTGKIQVELGENSTLYTGTENVAALCDFAEAETTIKGVTFTVVGNTVTLKGTATGTIGYSLKYANADTDLASGETPLPERQYMLSQYVLYNNGDHIPSFAIRSKQGGNLVVVQGAAMKSVDYTQATCGQFCLILTSGKTYDISFVLGVYPMSTGITVSMRKQTSKVKAITENGVAFADGYTWVNGDATVQTLFPKSYTSRPFCRYENRSVAYTGAIEVVDVYIPAKVGYVHILLGHCQGVATASNAPFDCWRIIRFSSVDSGLVNRYHITQNGETEMAVKIKGRDDFIGGHSHGDERSITGSVVFILDGEKVDPTTLTDLIEFDELRVFEVTAMYDPADHATQVATHGKEYVITKDGVELNQSVNWLGEYGLDASYMPMACAIRGNDTTSAMQITDTYIDDGNFIPYDVSTAGFTGYPRNLKDDVSKITLLSDKSGLCFSVSILETPELTGRGTYLFNGAAYNKIYCAVCGYEAEHTTSVGEKWRVRAKFQIEVGKGTGSGL